VTIQSIAVGSVPDALRAKFKSGALSASDIPTRLQPTDPRVSLSMFSEFAALADGIPVESASPDDLAVRKVQLIGPVTLLRTETETLHTSIRRIRAGLDTLLELHPDLDELWLDEPMLSDAPDDWLRLLGHTVRALKTEYLGVRVGVHSCGNFRDLDLSSVDADVWALDLHRDFDAVLDTWARAKPNAEIVWSVIPTTGEAISSDLPARIYRAHQELQPDRPLRVSTACGLGTRKERTVEAVLKHQQDLVRALQELAAK